MTPVSSFSDWLINFSKHLNCPSLYKPHLMKCTVGSAGFLFMLLHHFLLYDGLGVMPITYKLYFKVNFALLGLATGGMKVLVSHVTTRIPTSTLQCYMLQVVFISFGDAY